MNTMSSAAERIVMENIRLMSLDQESARDTLHYKDIAMEATQTPQGMATTLQKLYRSIIGRRGINFGKIPESRGDLTKYFKYANICNCMDALDEALGQINPPEYVLLKKLHNFLITCRADFEYGFKSDNDYLKLTYNTLVMSLHEMVNVCIVIYVDYIKQPMTTNYRYTGFDKQKLVVVKNLEDIVAMWESGEWAKLVLEIRKGGKNFLGMQPTVADADTGGEKNAGWAQWFFAGLISAGAPAGLIHKVENSTLVKGATKTIGTFVTKNKTATLIISLILAAFFIGRGLVTLYYNSAYSLKSKIEHNEEFLRIRMEANKAMGNESAYNKQMWLYEHMLNLKDHIETKVFKENAIASSELTKENRTEFSASAMRNANTADMNDMATSVDDDSFVLG